MLDNFPSVSINHQLKNIFSLFSRLTIFSSRLTIAFNGQYTRLTIILSKNNMYECVCCKKTPLKLKGKDKKINFCLLPKGQICIIHFYILVPYMKTNRTLVPRGTETGPAQTLCEHIIPHLKHSSHNEFFYLYHSELCFVHSCAFTKSLCLIT